MSYETEIKEKFTALCKANKVNVPKSSISVEPSEHIVNVTVDLSGTHKTKAAQKGMELITILMTDNDIGPLVFARSDCTKHHFTMPNGPESVQKIKLAHENSVILQAAEILKEAHQKTGRDFQIARGKVRKMFEELGFGEAAINSSMGTALKIARIKEGKARI